jgi:hypothetical protein
VNSEKKRQKNPWATGRNAIEIACCEIRTPKPSIGVQRKNPLLPIIKDNTFSKEPAQISYLPIENMGSY